MTVTPQIVRGRRLMLVLLGVAVAVVAVAAVVIPVLCLM